MQRLRTTFKRSRTPTGADMKTQSSLDVPRQVRSASFDEIQLEAARGAHAHGPGGRGGAGASVSVDAGGAGAALLAVPQNGGRSRSFDSAGSDDSGTFLEVPRLFARRRSGKTTPPPQCVHCRHMETWATRARSLERATPERALSSLASSSADEDEDEEPDAPHITLTLTLPPGAQPPPPCDTPPPASPHVAPSFELQPPADEPWPPAAALPGRRRSISRQEAFFVEPTGSSLENVSASDAKSEAEESASERVGGAAGGGGPLLVHDIYLTVPDLRRDRAASVDSCFSKLSAAGKTEELGGGEGACLTVPAASLRSRSVDIVLPTADQARYKALALAAPPQSPPPPPTSSAPHRADALHSRKAADGGGGGGGGTGGSGQRALRCTPDWSEAAVSGEHLWSPTSVSGDCCYVGDAECQKHGSRMKCSACKIVAHTACVDVLMERVQFACKPTFRDVGVRQYREQTVTHHHWVHRRSEKGKCKHCTKIFLSMRWVHRRSEKGKCKHCTKATAKQIKKFWMNCKAKARDAKTKINQRMYTGGGPNIPDMDPADDQVLAVVSKILPTINTADSDNFQDADADDDNESWIHKKNRAHVQIPDEDMEFDPPLIVVASTSAEEKWKMTFQDKFAEPHDGQDGAVAAKQGVTVLPTEPHVPPHSVSIRETPKMQPPPCPPSPQKTLRRKLNFAKQIKQTQSVDSLKIKIIEEDREHRLEKNKLELQFIKIKHEEEMAHLRKMRSLLEKEQELKVEILKKQLDQYS